MNTSPLDHPFPLDYPASAAHFGQWSDPTRVKYIFNFPNGYYASILRGRGTIGTEEGLYEAAVCYNGGGVAYDTPITDDVWTGVTPEEVARFVTLVSELPRRDVNE